MEGYRMFFKKFFEIMKARKNKRNQEPLLGSLENVPSEEELKELEKIIEEFRQRNS